MLIKTPPSRCTGSFREEYLESSDWVAEPKLDGGRYMLYLDGDAVNLFSRRDFPRIDKAANVPHFARTYPGLDGVILDGEVIIEKAINAKVELGETTAIMNSAPEKAIERQKVPGCLLHYVVFDILAVDGEDIRHLPLCERRIHLERVVAHMRLFHQAVHVVPQTQDKDGLFREMLDRGMEGTVIKNLGSRYGFNWVKCKRVADFSCVISGYKEAKPGKYAGGLGAVAVSVYQDGKLLEVGFASGMTDAERTDIWAHREEYLGRVVDISAQEVTKDGRMRHPRWLRFRDDVSPETCTFEKLLDDAKKARKA